MAQKKIITIDGPAGAGKSTASKVLASRLSYVYLDTGALYRAIAYKVTKTCISLDDDKALSLLSRNVNISLKNEDGKLEIFIDGEQITGKIRTEEISMIASLVSAHPCVRESLLHIQQEIGAQGGIVAEGRDMGTVVFPNADYKFYLDASVSERAKRRYKEITARNDIAHYAQIEKDIMVRDAQDMERAISPLKPAFDAIVIDSTYLSVTDVVEKMMQTIRYNYGEG